MKVVLGNLQIAVFLECRIICPFSQSRGTVHLSLLLAFLFSSSTAINVSHYFLTSYYSFLASSDGKCACNDTANLNIQPACHETTKSLWPCIRSTGINDMHNCCLIWKGSVTLTVSVIQLQKEVNQTLPFVMDITCFISS